MRNTSGVVHHRNRDSRIGLVLSFLAISLISSAPFPPIGSAQSITPSGLNTQVNLSPTPPAGHVQYDITGGTRPGGGTNLFHSFGDFTVPTNNIANFFNDSGLATSNILGRVTGGNISNIYGTIQTTGFGNANLFLMNPAGFLFGPNATMNVGGIMTFTTTDYLKLTDNVRFNAIPDIAADALLSPAPVAAFGFLSSNPGAITVQGSQFTVTEGTGISLVGGNVTIQSGTPEGGSAQPAQLSAPNGKIQLASAASPGEFDATTLQALPNVDGASFTSFGSITLAPSSNINVSGANTVSIRGGQFVLSVNNAVLSTATSPDSSDIIALSQGSLIVTSTSGVEPGADFEIIGKSLQIDGTTIQSLTTGDGAGGNITLKADSVNLTNGSIILSESDGTQSGGNILVQATNDVALQNGAFILGLTTGDGAGGNITLKADSVNLTNGSIILSESDGTQSGGNILVQTTDTVALQDGASILGITTGDAAGGNITVKAGAVNIADGAFIQSESFGTGNSGNLTFHVQNDLNVTGGAFLASVGGNSSGNISIAADRVLISGNDQNLPSSRIEIVNGGENKTGDIDLSVGQLILTGNARINSVSGVGDGNITISATEFVTVTDGAKIRMDNQLGAGGLIDIAAHTITFDQGIIQTLVTGIGDAGSVHVQADSLTLLGSFINSTTTGFGQAGAVTISVRDNLTISGQFAGSSTDFARPAGIYASTQSIGDAGSISVNAGTVELSGGTRIENSSTGLATGNAGPITISAPSVVVNGGVITTSTETTGNAGAIDINTNSLSLSNGGQIASSSLLRTAALFPGEQIPVTSGASGTVTVQGLHSPAQSVLVDGVGSGIFTDAQGTGAGGDITIQTKTLTIQNGGTISAATSGLDEAAIGGDVTVNASQAVNLRNNASISARSTGTADAGNITINAGNRFEARDSSVTTKSEQAGGGNIEINARDLFRLVNSQVNASAFLDGGNITIDPTLVLLQNSQILAQSIQGNGGNITITTPLFLSDQSSLVSASSQFGLNGTVTIQKPTSNLSGSLGTLTSKPSQAQSLLTQRCAALVNGQASSFVVAGREQLPSDPGSWLTSPLALAGIDAEDTSNLAPRTSNLSATGMVSLRRLTPARFLMANFADSEATGCHS